MPAPAGALTVLLPLYLYFLGLLPESIALIPPVIGYVLFVAFMMVSRLPTFSGKRIGSRVSREHVLPIFVAVVVIVAVVVSYPLPSLALVIVGYLATLPVSWRMWHRKNAETAAAETPAADDDEDEEIDEP